MTRSPPDNPLVAVIGATGTGKSQLAVELAKRYNGEIVNCDAMQLYAGLPIITNKITAEEQEGIPHHLLGCIGLHEQPWVVGTFVKKALSVIDEIRSRGRLPILVGGTHYYTQSLLFKDRLAEAENEVEVKDFVVDTKEQWPILQESTEVLLDELRKVDPIMADRWHPNDRRKVQRSLEIYMQTGKRASDIYAEQRRTAEVQSLTSDKDENGALEYEAGMRFPTLLFWVHAETTALQLRLDKRVDKMVEQGLLDEVRALNEFAETVSTADTPVDETRGVWVSIGFKEFKSYAKALENDICDKNRLTSLKREALERTKIATRQYAKRQLRWIRIKLVNALADAKAGKNLYLLDGTNIFSFNQDVVTPALELTHDFLTAVKPLPTPTLLSDAAAQMLVPKRNYDLAAMPQKWTRQYCEHCNVTCVTEEQWAMHVKSKPHRKLVGKAPAATRAP